MTLETPDGKGKVIAEIIGRCGHQFEVEYEDGKTKVWDASEVKHVQEDRHA